MKSLTSFTINVAKGNKRKVGKSKNKVSRLCKGIVVKEDGEYQVRINTLDDPNNPSFITIPFTFDSYEVKDREFVFERNNTSNNKYICHVRDKYKAKVFPGSKKQYIPFYKNVIVCGNIVKILGRLHFQFKDLIAFSPTSIPIHDYNIDESKPLLK